MVPVVLTANRYRRLDSEGRRAAAIVAGRPADLFESEARSGRPLVLAMGEDALDATLAAMTIGDLVGVLVEQRHPPSAFDVALAVTFLATSLISTLAGNGLVLLLGVIAVFLVVRRRVRWSRAVNAWNRQEQAQDPAASAPLEAALAFALDNKPSLAGAVAAAAALPDIQVLDRDLAVKLVQTVQNAWEASGDGRQASWAARQLEHVQREGPKSPGPWHCRFLVLVAMDRHQEWPRHCPACDAPSSTPTRVAFETRDMSYWWFVFFYPICLGFWLLRGKRRASGDVYFCDRHRAFHHLGRAAALAGPASFLAGSAILASYLWFVSEPPEDSLARGFLLLAALGVTVGYPASLFASRALGPLRASRTLGPTVQISGCCSSFRQRLAPVAWPLPARVTAAGIAPVPSGPSDPFEPPEGFG